VLVVRKGREVERERERDGKRDRRKRETWEKRRKLCGSKRSM
jgi:hypothetical protein